MTTKQVFLLLLHFLYQMASSSTPTCLLPDDTQVKTIINGLQHIELENRRLRAVNVSYNCIQHNASLMNGMIERLVVTITLPIGHPQRWNFVCQPDGSFQATWLRHADGTTSSIDIDAFNCGTCSSNGYCRGCDDSCVVDSCHGSDASECCNYVYDGECVVHCPDRYGPGVNRTCECSDYWRGETCEVCSYECQNGGTRDSNCTTCLCPINYSGEFCETHTPTTAVPTTNDGKLTETPTPADCSRPCINGIRDSSCTQCVCFANYQGSDCSECVPNRKCLERCSQEGYFVHEGTGNCFRT